MTSQESDAVVEMDRAYMRVSKARGDRATARALLPASLITVGQQEFAAAQRAKRMLGYPERAPLPEGGGGR